MVLTAPPIDGVHDEGDALRVGVAQVPLGGAQVNPNKTPSELPRDNRHVPILGLEGRPVDLWGLLWQMSLHFSPCPLFFDRGYRLHEYNGCLLYGG